MQERVGFQFAVFLIYYLRTFSTRSLLVVSASCILVFVLLAYMVALISLRYGGRVTVALELFFKGPTSTVLNLS